MATLFWRFVAEMEFAPDARLRSRAGVGWRSEPARGEAAIHRRLAALADASEARIVAFASTYGLLRLGSARLHAAPEPVARGATFSMSQAILDDFGPVRAWLEAGTPEPVPEGVRDLLAVVQLVAGLPEPTLRAMRLMAADAPDAEVEEAAGQSPVDPAAILGGMLEAAILARDQAPERPADRERLLAALELLEWFGRILGGIDEGPAELARMGGPAEAFRNLLGILPEALAHPELADERSATAAGFMDELATESVSDWRAVAAQLIGWIDACQLVRRALDGGLSADEKLRLADVYGRLTGSAPPVALSSAELAERTQPLLEAGLEAELQRGGAWPIWRGAVLGLYWRALIALLSEFTERRPLVRCETSGCTGTIPFTRNRRFCEACRRQRGHEAVARHRARRHEAPQELRDSPRSAAEASST